MNELANANQLHHQLIALLLLHTKDFPLQSQMFLEVTAGVTVPLRLDL